MIPFSFPLMLISCLIFSISCTASACVITENKPSWRAYGWIASLLILHNLIMFLAGLKDSPWNLPISVSLQCMSLYLAFRITGWRLVRCFLTYFAYTMLSELCMGLVVVTITPMELSEGVRYYTHPFCILAQVVTVSGVFVMLGLYVLIRHLRRNREDLLMAVRCLRIAMTLLIIILLVFNTPVIYGGLESLTDQQQFAQQGQQMLLYELCIILLLLLASTYLWQDIKYVMLYRQNRALLHNQETQDLLLRRSRMFHHNLANVLCGLQGTIHSRDFSSIDAYCDEIVRRCQMINNQNVEALKQVPRSAVSLLIQQKILDANEAGVPFYVHADDDLHWRSWRDGDMCQLLGVLLDNAIEAASAADAPYLSMELHNLPGSMELVVRNTWGSAARKDPPVSSVPARGLGLPSVQTLLKRYPRTTFSLYHRDRYVEAHLTF